MDTDMQAFPIKGPVMTNDAPGMTLRDYFATQAMQGLLANGWLAEERDINLQAGYQEIAVDAYMMAEAMLKARKRYAEKS